MAGTIDGGKQASETNKAKYGEDYYKRIGSMGGTRTHKLGKLYDIGFGGDRERARIAGAKGGKISRRPSKR